MKKTIAIFGISALSLAGVSVAQAGVSFHFGASINLAPPVYPAPVYAAPVAVQAPVYVPARTCAPAVVYVPAPAPVRVYVPAPAPVIACVPPVVYGRPGVYVAPPFVNVGVHYGRGHHHHRHHHHHH